MLSLAFAGPAAALKIPFPVERNIVTNFSRPECVIAADVDGDLDLDVLGAASTAGAVAWWENVDGSGTNWIEHTVDGAFAGAHTVFAADLDGDGDVDVAGAGESADTVAWWENAGGSGTNWIEHVVDGSFDGARSVVVADVDQDGRLDVIGAAVVGGEIAWWRNLNGSGTNWLKHTVAAFTGADCVASADIDDDGNLDIVASAGTGNAVSWWANTDGAGTNWTQHVIDAAFGGAQSVRTVDMDQDGDLDVVGAAHVDNEVRWWENLGGAGTNWAVHYVVAGFNGAYAVIVDDLDLDGDPDLLAAADVADDATWFENADGKGTNWVTHTVNGTFDGARSVFAADLDHDGDPDVLGAAYIANRLAWWENKTIHRSAAFCDETVVDSTFEGAQSVALVDMEGDGDVDLIGAASDSQRVSWWENADGAGSVWLERPVDTNVPGAWAAVAADLNGDARPDILGAARDADTVEWWESPDGIEWSNHVVDASFGGVRSVAAADLDLDGDQDVVGAAYTDHEISWWENVGGAGTTWVKRVVDAAFTGAASVTATDINGDKIPDLVAAARFLNQVAWWENLDGSGTNWTKRVIAGAFGGAVAVAVADMDRDGDLDVLGAAFDLDRISWWENVGGAGTNWVEHVVDGALDGASAVGTADLDGDGDLDVLGGAQVENVFAWWENTDGGGAAWVRHDVILGALQGGAVAAADVDRDAAVDFIGAAADASGPFAEDIFWLRNEGGQFALVVSNTAPVIVAQRTTNCVLALTLHHRGRSGDSDAELAGLQLLFEESPGDALTTEEATNLVRRVALYRDDGSGAFESGADSLVAQVTTLTLASGTLVVPLSDGDPLLAFSAATPATYFVVLVFTDSAASRTPHQLRVTVLPDVDGERLGPAEDREADIALVRECSTGSLSSVVVTLKAAADLAVTKIGTPNPLALDSNVLFTITVTNLGADVASGVVVTDALPAVVSFNAADSSPECTLTGGVVVCVLGSVTGHQAKAVLVSVTVHGDAQGALTNWATAATDSIDTNPSDNIASAVITLPDSDLDGDSDFHDPDDDNDGMPDYFELAYGLNRTNSADATGDEDGDLIVNLDEYIADTDPTNGLSYLRIDEITPPSPAQIYFDSSTGRVYTLQFTSDPAVPAWSNVAGQVGLPGLGAMDSLVDVDATNARVYRLQVELP